MNVLFLDHFNRHGGAQEYILDIISGLSSQKDISCHLSNPLITSLKSIFPPNAKNIGFSILDKSYRSLSFYVNFIKDIYLLKKYIRKNNIHLIHCNSIPTLPLAKIVAGNKIPIVFTCHDLSLKTIHLYLIRKCASAIICVSNTVSRFLQNNGIKDNIFVLPNGFKDCSRKEFEILPKILTFAIIGRVEPWKGIDLFIRAAQIVINHKPTCTFYIIGAAEKESFLIDLKKMSAENIQIKFFPFIDQKELLYKNISVLVNASIEEEPFGRTLVEAAIYNRPVIGPDKGGPADIIEDKISGLLFRSGSIKDLADKMLFFANNPQSIQIMGQAGRKLFKERYEIESVIKLIVKIYSQLEKKN